MSLHPFGFIELPADRSTSKPRANGLTMMIDWGLGLRQLEDVLEMSGDHVDLGKIAVGTPRVYDEALLIGEFGANVNIANVMPDDVMETEVLRAGLSVIHVGDGSHAGHAG